VKRLIAAIATVVVLVGATVALAASSPTGAYTTTITGKGANTLEGALDGVWTITFKSGKYSVVRNEKAVTHGDYTIKGTTISLTDKGGPDKCKGTGKYKFKLAGKTLTFTKISDTAACGGRTAVLAHKLLRS
jgi:hypothetical protein